MPKLSILGTAQAAGWHGSDGEKMAAPHRWKIDTPLQLESCRS
jgi:hypothetical protein